MWSEVVWCCVLLRLCGVEFVWSEVGVVLWGLRLCGVELFCC